MLPLAVIKESSALNDFDVQKMLPAFDSQWNKDLHAVWDQADALAYHDLTNEGLPISKIFVKTILADKASVSVGATHEICEMAVDPWLNSAYQDDQGIFWAGEVCDPVEDDSYGYHDRNHPGDGTLSRPTGSAMSTRRAKWTSRATPRAPSRC